MAAGCLGASGMLRILVVDDNVDAAKSLSLLLEIWGYVTRTATASADALADFLAFQPHVVFLDLGMPEMDGLELARILREQSATQPCIFALTGYADDDHRSLAARDFDGYLVKPVNPSALEELLASLARRQALMAEDLKATSLFH